MNWSQTVIVCGAILAGFGLMAFMTSGKLSSVNTAVNALTDSINELTKSLRFPRVDHSTNNVRRTDVDENV